MIICNDFMLGKLTTTYWIFHMNRGAKDIKTLENDPRRNKYAYTTRHNATTNHSVVHRRFKSHHYRTGVVVVARVKWSVSSQNAKPALMLWDIRQIQPSHGIHTSHSQSMYLVPQLVTTRAPKSSSRDLADLVSLRQKMANHGELLDQSCFARTCYSATQSLALLELTGELRMFPNTWHTRTCWTASNEMVQNWWCSSS